MWHAWEKCVQSNLKTSWETRCMREEIITIDVKDVWARVSMFTLM